MVSSSSAIGFATAILVAISASVESEKILMVFPFPSKSHFIMLEPLAKGLAARGHQVTVMGYFPQKTPIQNYRDINLQGTTEDFSKGVSVEHIFRNWRSMNTILDFIWREAGYDHCDVLYKSEQIRSLLESKEKFDLLMIELFGSDCMWPLASVLNVPQIAISTTMEMPWSLNRYGLATNPAYQVNLYLEYPPGRLNFWQRLVNSLVLAYIKIGYYFRSELPSDEVARRHLGRDIPPLAEIQKNSSLQFVNAHFSIIGPRPLTPNVIDVGGLHIQPSEPLPSELKTLLDGSKQGVVLFSLGSLIRPDTIKPEILNIFVEEFRRLPQTVVWKFNGTIPNQPKNLKIMKWLPQRDILAHPNVKLFITHGGQMGTQEAIYEGVPMLGIPFFADQRFNIRNYQEKGFAIKVEFEDISPEVIRKSLHELLHNPRYAETAKHYSKLFRDRPRTPLEEAIYWSEYVLRHRGAPHLQSVAANMSFIEYYLLDVLAFLTIAIVLVFYIIYLFYRKFISRTSKQKTA